MLSSKNKTKAASCTEQAKPPLSEQTETETINHPPSQRE
jgi:hypothetical protein